MCRNIRTLFNFSPPATKEEIHSAALQFVRKISGSAKPSEANKGAFDTATLAIEAASALLLESLQTKTPAKNRDEEAAKAKARNARRFG